MTSAALILMFAFLVLSSSPGFEIKEFAIGLAAGIIFDATVIRALLVPSLMRLLGDANWWMPNWARAALFLPAGGAGPRGGRGRERVTFVRVQSGIHADELSTRRELLLEHAVEQKLDGYVLFDEKYIQYFTSFGFLATERPVALIGGTSGELAVFVPEFEVERVREETDFEHVESYPEYPGVDHPMLILGRVLEEHRPAARSAADGDGYPGILGYAGPALSSVTGGRVAPLGRFIESLMRCKSPAEVELIRESARWCGHAHRLLQEYSRARHDRSRGEPARRARGDARLARRARAALRRPAGARRTARPRATAARSAAAAPGRTPSRTTSSSGPATSSSPRRAHPSGATTPSSSGRW